MVVVIIMSTIVVTMVKMVVLLTIRQVCYNDGSVGEDHSSGHLERLT